MANRLTKFIQHPQKANEAELKWSFFHFDCLFSFNLIALLLLLTFSYNLTSKIAKKKINVSSFWIKFNFFSIFLFFYFYFHFNMKISLEKKRKQMKSIETQERRFKRRIYFSVLFFYPSSYPLKHI